MKNLEDFQIESDADLKSAMEAITANGRGIIFVTEKQIVVGVLSDGDIRRALLNDITMLAPVESIMNPEFAFSTASDKSAVKKMMEEKKISAVPVLDGQRRLTDLFFIDEL